MIIVEPRVLRLLRNKKNTSAPTIPTIATAMTAMPALKPALSVVFLGSSTVSACDDADPTGTEDVVDDIEEVTVAPVVDDEDAADDVARAVELDVDASAVVPHSPKSD